MEAKVFSKKIYKKHKALHGSKLKNNRVRIFEARISALEKQISIYNEFVKAEFENNICPVTLEEFDSSINPPYLGYGCNHRISLAALKGLKVIPVRIEGKIRTTYMNCPICQNRMLFASLDFAYLKFSRLQQLLTNPQYASQNLNLQTLAGNHPHYFTPIKGCLSSSQYLL